MDKKIRDLHPALNGRQRRAWELACGVGPAQTRALVYLRARGPSTMHQIRRAVDCGIPSIQSMEVNGFMRSMNHNGSMMELTDKGRQKVVELAGY